MRLIDADAPEIQNCEGVAREIVLGLIAKQPTVDAVQVVRCRDCQKCYYDEEWKAYVAKPGCPLDPIGFGYALIEPDGYCSRGVRKEAQTDDDCGARMDGG